MAACATTRSATRTTNIEQSKCLTICRISENSKRGDATGLARGRYAEAVRAELSAGQESTVRTVLRRLEEKG